MFPRNEVGGRGGRGGEGTLIQHRTKISIKVTFSFQDPSHVHCIFGKIPKFS